MIVVSLLFLLLCGVVFSLATNKDVFSPGKFYHLFLCVYFIDIFVSPHNSYVYVTYAGYILLGFVISMLERLQLGRQHGPTLVAGPKFRIPNSAIVVLWILSVVPLIAQLYVIHLSGGLDTFDTVFAHRVKEWQGLGHIRIWIKLLPLINLAYYAIGLLSSRSLSWWLLYTLHLGLFILVAAPTGSRGLLLYQAVYMAMLYHYLRRNLRVATAGVLCCALLLTACFLGSFRQKIVGNLHDPLAVVNASLESLNFNSFEYGVIPLDIIFEDEFADYRYGTTFVSALTNFVPRRLWPSKFESGGVVLTRFAHGQAYIGTSHYSTGLLAESILNFGYGIGIALAAGMFIVIGSLNVRLYSYWLRCAPEQKCSRFLFILLVYPLLVQVTGSLLYGEFTNIIFGNIVRCVFAVLVVTCVSFHQPSFSRGLWLCRRLWPGRASVLYRVRRPESRFRRKSKCNRLC